MKLILSETEPDAIIYCPVILVSERCMVAILHSAERAEWTSNMYKSAFDEQRKFEVYRAYKDLGPHIVSYLCYPEEGYEQHLVAFMQIKYMIGGFSEIVFPPHLEKVCSVIRGNPKLRTYPPKDSNLPSDVEILQKKALSRFRSIKGLEQFSAR